MTISEVSNAYFKLSKYIVWASLFEPFGPSGGLHGCPSGTPRMPRPYDAAMDGSMVVQIGMARVCDMCPDVWF